MKSIYIIIIVFFRVIKKALSIYIDTCKHESEFLRMYKRAYNEYLEKLNKKEK